MNYWSLIIVVVFLLESSNSLSQTIHQKSSSKFLDDQITADSDVTTDELNDDYTSISHLNEVKNIILQKDQELEAEKKKANET